MAQIFTLPKATAFDTNGTVIPGARLYFYSQNTTTPKTVYSEYTLTTPLTQPVEADSAGRFPVIYLSTGNYKVILKDAADATIYTADYLDTGLPAGAGALPVLNGGTGATDAAGARTNLGAASAADLSALQSGQGALATKNTVARTDLASGFGYVILQQSTVASTTSVITCSGAIPNDNTIPQIGEGTQVFTGNFTPISASSVLDIQTQVRGAASAAQIAASGIFTNSDVNAIAAVRCQVSAQHMGAILDIHHRLNSPGTNQIAFSVRAGANTGTFYVNGDGSGTAYLGGVQRAQMVITEYLSI